MSKTQEKIEAQALRIAALEKTLSATKTDLGLADIRTRQEYELRLSCEAALDERNEALDAARKRVVELDAECAPLRACLAEFKEEAKHRHANYTAFSAGELLAILAKHDVSDSIAPLKEG